MNRRKLIRNYVASLLANSLEDVPVYRSRRIPIERGDCRAINVSIEKECRCDLHPRFQLTVLQVLTLLELDL